MSGQITRRRDWTDDDAVDQILDAVVETIPEIRRALVERRETLDEENPSGDTVSAADAYADERLEARLLDLDAVGTYTSEERDDAVTADGAYHVAVDPLDGSSNLRSNNPMGTIVGVYDEPLPTVGENLVAAAFVLYGPNTTMVVADEDGVTEYLVDDGECSVLTDDLTIPDDPVAYGFGGRRPDWIEPVESFVEEIEAERLKLRYGGALIADVRQVLTHGGIFAYPELEDRPEGKLRYQFECAPIGFVVSAAGGRVSDGHGDLLAAEPDELHQRTPFYAGDPDLVERFESQKN